MGKSGLNAAFNLILFLGLGWPWVGEFVGFLEKIRCFPTQRIVVNRKHPTVGQYLDWNRKGLRCYTKGPSCYPKGQMLPKGSQLLPKGSQRLPKGSQLLPKESELLPKESELLPKESHLLPKGSQSCYPNGCLLVIRFIYLNIQPNRLQAL